MATPDNIDKHLLKISDELKSIEEQLYEFYKKEISLSLEELRAIHIDTVFIDEKIRDIRGLLDMLKVKGKGRDII